MSNTEEQARIAVAFCEAIGSGGLDDSQYDGRLTAWSLLSGMMTRAEYLQNLQILPRVFTMPLRMKIDAVTAQPGRVAVQARSSGGLWNGQDCGNDYHFLVEVN